METLGSDEFLTPEEQRALELLRVAFDPAAEPLDALVALRDLQELIAGSQRHLGSPAFAAGASPLADWGRR